MKKLFPFLAAALIAGCVSKPPPAPVPVAAVKPVVKRQAFTVPGYLYPPKVVTAAKRMTSASIVPPPPARTNLLLSWDYGTNHSMTRVWFTPDLSQPMTLLTNTPATNYSTVISSDSGFFRVRPAPESVTLEWIASISTNVAGYKIYWGTTSGVYSNTDAFGNVTNARIDLPVLGTAYFFAATAVDGLGIESPFSNEATWTATTNSLTPQNFQLLLR